MLSGRYRTDQLLRHFTDNDGSCVICPDGVPGNIQHWLLICPALTDTRNRLLMNLDLNSDMSELAKSFIRNTFKSNETATQLLLDPSVLPGSISIKQKQDPFIFHQLFKFSRSWCYAIHKSRLKLQGRWRKWSNNNYFLLLLHSIIYLLQGSHVNFSFC